VRKKQKTVNTKPRVRRRRRLVGVSVLAIDSSYDAVTRAAFNYRQQHVYPYLESKGFTIIKCQGVLARHLYVAEAVRGEEVDFLTGVGHGLPDAYTGDKYDPIFQVGDYTSEEVHGKIVHFLACYSALKLGADLVKHGCRAFFGYSDAFTCHLEEEPEVFFDCDSEIDRAFADGLSAEEVYDRVRVKYDRHIDELYNAGKYHLAATLTFNSIRLCAPSIDARWGDPKARLNDSASRRKNRRK
jgi:hypothetical protein